MASQRSGLRRGLESGPDRRVKSGSRRGLKSLWAAVFAATLCGRVNAEESEQIGLEFDPRPRLEDQEEELILHLPEDFPCAFAMLFVKEGDASCDDPFECMDEFSLLPLGDRTVLRYQASPALAGMVMSFFVAAISCDGDGSGSDPRTAISPIARVGFRSPGVVSSVEELGALPTEGAAWQALRDEADEATGEPDLSDGNSDVNVRVLAKALAYARTGASHYRDDVVDACGRVIGTEGNRTLDLGRELAAYVIAADLVGLPMTSTASFAPGSVKFGTRRSGAAH